MACILDGRKLTLSGTVGDGWGDCFEYPQVLLALAEVPDGETLTVHINSGGGIATEGAAIHALLSQRSGRTDVVIEGVAASAASLIAMAGETVSMAEGAVAMVHDPAGLTFGNSADHAKTIEGLEALATSYARVYATKTGKTVDECREIMKSETWFTAEQAVEAGFADKVLSRSAAAVASFDYSKYDHAPKALRAVARDWRKANDTAAKSAATRQQPKEAKMTDDKKADEKPAVDVTAERQAAVMQDRARRQAIMSLDEARGREGLAEHLYLSTDMDADTVKAVLAAAPVAEEKPVPALALAGAGLGGAAQPQLRVDLAAQMKQRLA